ncbi:MAG: hypothetical protein IKE76_04505 [Clostridia bacterium]|nr:hypothetical protein [Clostridia bacterium]
MATTQKGYCYICGAELTRTGMQSHILKKHAGFGDQLCRLIRVEGTYNRDYWLYLDMPVNATLASLDKFLRAVWLECCGHLSAFYMGRYDEIPMSRKLERLDANAVLPYEYDFGSTTDLTVTFLGNCYRPRQRNHVRLLARNKPFEFTCGKCGKPAEYVNALEIDSEDNPFLCEACSKGVEFILPITNSPRMGVCGYCGELDKYEYRPENAGK